MFWQPVVASVPDLYEEIRIHNEKLEARLADWLHRAKAHSTALSTSSHPALVRWRSQIAHVDFHDELAGLAKLNSAINQDVQYLDDYHHYHRQDYWADPETTLEEGGDCEDIALLKAASLHRLNWPAERMHLLIGYLTERGEKESHAVLLVEMANGEQRILRSLTNDVVHPSAFKFIPLFAVDQAGTLIVKAPLPPT